MGGHTWVQTTGEDNGMRWILTGGGGGVTSDTTPSHDGNDNAYGFIDFKINRTHLQYDMHTWGGNSNEPVGKEIIWKSVTFESKKLRSSYQRVRGESEVVV